MGRYRVLNISCRCFHFLKFISHPTARLIILAMVLGGGNGGHINSKVVRIAFYSDFFSFVKYMEEQKYLGLAKGGGEVEEEVDEKIPFKSKRFNS